MAKPGIMLSAQTLSALMLRKRVTAAEMADDLDLAPQRLSRIASEKDRVSIDALRRIEAYFGCDALEVGLVHPDDRARFDYAV